MTITKLSNISLSIAILINLFMQKVINKTATDPEKQFLALIINIQF
ncbi:hypothetical protein ACE1B6_13325 [Aerosakkonemataceae cyanobacterium BLCC-F154]|uniref:Uncharacterized protein n=1 Tax=Floridaenema fluviatile BLCC-F154 TaxID=3153640 RepID=A0ABV4YC24_9CYAN